MNEGMYVYLNFDKLPMEDEEKILERVDAILLKNHIRYSGFQNLYVPENKMNRDSDIYMGRQALLEDEILGKAVTNLPVATITNACPLENIQVKEMSRPLDKKYARYEAYFKETGRLAHPIVVDEHGRLRDGYISYLLAKQYELTDIRVSVMEAMASQPIYKVVTGRHVVHAKDDDGFEIKSQRLYNWVCNIREAVVPGDVLLVGTRRGTELMRVDRIDMRTGKCWRRGLCQVKGFPKKKWLKRPANHTIESE